MLNLRRSPTLKAGNSPAHWQPSPIPLNPTIIIIMTISIVSILVVIIVVVTAALPAILVIFK